MPTDVFKAFFNDMMKRNQIYVSEDEFAEIVETHQTNLNKMESDSDLEDTEPEYEQFLQ